MRNLILKSVIISVLLLLILGRCNARHLYNVEKISIDNPVKEKIMMSSLKMNLHGRDGRVFTAYLYAEDETSERTENVSCRTGNDWISVSKTGNFYIYLYDVLAKSFSPYRTKIFTDFDGFVMFNVEGAHLIVLPGIKHIKPDVFIISQFGVCDRNFHEAFGFSENNLYLENYKFIDRNKREYIQLGGLMATEPDNDKLHFADIHNGENSYNMPMHLYLSEKDGKIHVEPDLNT